MEIFLFQCFKDEEGKEHFCIFKNLKDMSKNIADNTPIVRFHSECLTGDVFASLKCDCGEQLEQSLKLINEKGGMIIYLRQEGRGIGLFNKINAYSLQDKGLDTIQADDKLGFSKDLRSYSTAEFILKHHNIKKIKILTNNPLKTKGLKEIQIEEMLPIIVEANKHNKKYLQIKKEQMGHKL